MIKPASFLLSLALAGIFSVSAFSANGPDDPAGRGNGILGVSIGPGVPFYGGNGFGPAFVIHYDHGIWQAGPGTISLGGFFGTSLFWDTYSAPGIDYNQSWTNLGFNGRAAYHYGWKVPGLDTYAGFGIGARISIYNNEGWSNGKSSSSVGALPTFFFGSSYFFNEIFGVNGEMGYNFTYAQIGVNFRIIR